MVYNVSSREGVAGYSAYVRLPDPDTMVACLEQAHQNDLVALAISPPSNDNFNDDAFGPTEDGVELKEPLQKLARGPAPAGVALLAGSNLDEGTEFMDYLPRIRCNANSSELQQWFYKQFGPDLGARAMPLYAGPEKPTPLCAPGKTPTTAQWVGAMRAAGDEAIACRSRELLKAAHTAGSGNWRYLFTVTPKYSVNWPNGSMPYEGSFHGAEVPFVFGDRFEVTTKAEIKASLAMGCWWTNFAATGNPNVGPDGDGTGCAAALQLPDWPMMGDGGVAMVISNHTQHPLKARPALKKAACDVFAQFP